MPTTTSVFWPRGSTRSGWCYGWIEPVICIAGVVEDASDLDAARTTLATTTDANPPRVLGKCKFEAGNKSPIPFLLDLWDVHSNTTFSVILYSPHAPHSLRYYAMNLPSPDWPNSNPEPLDDPYSALAAHDFTHRDPTNVEAAINQTVIDQMNTSFLLQNAVTEPDKTTKLLPTTASLLLTIAAHSTILSPFLLVTCRFLASLVNVPLPSFYSSPASHHLKDISAVVQQLDVRIEQTIFFITQVSTLKRQNTRNPSSYASRYTTFFNTVWLIMNDITIGTAFGTFLMDNDVVLAELANKFVQTYLFELPRSILFWLDAWPAGLKLNSELSRFYATSLVGVIDTWRAVLPPLHPALFRTLGILSSAGGFTLLLSLLSDLCLLLTAHLRLGYELTRWIYWAAGVKLGGGLLWGVFRGKRRNVLRNRTDTWEYDMDQLLFGTVLFTLIAFLWPTALVYYVLFAVLRLATLLFQACVDTMLAFMHHFPLFALMLRVKDPDRLPGNLYFAVETLKEGRVSDSPDCISPVYLSLKNQPISLSVIFFQYIELSKRLAKHYNPLRLLFLVLSGRHLASIPRYSIRYGLPSESNLEQDRMKEKIE